MQKLNVFICTANIGNAKPSISSLIPKDGEMITRESSTYHILPNDEYFEECVNISFEEENVELESNMESTFFDIIAIGMQESTFSVEDIEDLGETKNGSNTQRKENNEVSSKEEVEILNEPVIRSNKQNQNDNLSKMQEKISSNKTSKFMKTFRKVDKFIPSFKTVTLPSYLDLMADEDHTKHSSNSLLRSNPKCTKFLLELILTRCPSYKTVVNYQRGEMRLIILVRNNRIKDVTEVKLFAGNTGVGNLANKGGIVANITIFKTRLSFVTAHLAAHEGQNYYNTRCSNMEDILCQAKGNHFPDSYDASVSSHHVFVFGDLNFRINLNRNNKEEEHKAKEEHEKHVEMVLKLIEAKDWKTLNKHDELLTAIEERKFCAGFKTLFCSFPPTFKVERNEGFQYQKQRTPSYTDRILWKSCFGLQSKLIPLYYEPCPSFTTSDHKPIRGAFSIESNMKENYPRISFKNVLKRSIHQRLSPKTTLHMYVSDMSCKSLNSKYIILHCIPYLVFLPSPIHLLPLVTNEKFRGSPKTKENPKIINHSRDDKLNPNWGDEEVHVVVNVEDEAKLQGGILFITVVYSCKTRDDIVVGSVPLDLFQIGSAAYHSLQAYNDDLEKDELKTFHIKQCPIIKNGLVNGFLNCNILAFWSTDEIFQSKNIGLRRQKPNRKWFRTVLQAQFSYLKSKLYSKK